MRNVLAQRIQRLKAESAASAAVQPSSEQRAGADNTHTGNNPGHGLGHLVRGIERESLRVDEGGVLATTPHPRGLGAALTNPHITTDYSEALLELVTPVFTSAPDVISYLDDLHSFVYQNIADERLWCTSMPCIVPQDDQVPIAHYGTSHVGFMKEVYRRGLGHRYGRVMQTIAGLHYNVSLPESFWELDARAGILEPEQANGTASSAKTDSASYRSRHYFGLVRNVHRYTWLLLYLFGASPAVCKSFLAGRDHDLENLDEGTVYLPHATSLRMSDLGYQNNAQDGLDIRYNDLESYTRSLISATETPYGPYEEIGVEVDGEWRQLNANIIQIENEYYAPVRPKRVANSGEKPSRALLDRGVEYIEIRALDLDPYAYSGIDARTVYFLDVFTVFCLLEDSPPVTDEDQARFTMNQARVVKSGRSASTLIETDAGSTPLVDIAKTLLEKMRDVAQLMDDDAGIDAHTEAVDQQLAKVLDPEKTPAARMLSDMAQRSERFSDIALRMSNEHRERGIAADIDPSRLALFTKQVEESLALQQQLEAADDSADLAFGDYLSAYFAR